MVLIRHGADHEMRRSHLQVAQTLLQDMVQMDSAPTSVPKRLGRHLQSPIGHQRCFACRRGPALRAEGGSGAGGE
jgi:hypothetical protein